MQLRERGAPLHVSSAFLETSSDYRAPCPDDYATNDKQENTEGEIHTIDTHRLAGSRRRGGDVPGGV